MGPMLSLIRRLGPLSCTRRGGPRRGVRDRRRRRLRLRLRPMRVPIPWRRIRSSRRRRSTTPRRLASPYYSPLRRRRRRRRVRSGQRVRVRVSLRLLLLLLLPLVMVLRGPLRLTNGMLDLHLHRRRQVLCTPTRKPPFRLRLPANTAGIRPPRPAWTASACTTIAAASCTKQRTMRSPGKTASPSG